jgi:hypothetical protein
MGSDHSEVPSLVAQIARPSGALTPARVRRTLLAMRRCAALGLALLAGASFNGCGGDGSDARAVSSQPPGSCEDQLDRLRTFIHEAGESLPENLHLMRRLFIAAERGRSHLGRGSAATGLHPNARLAVDRGVFRAAQDAIASDLARLKALASHSC